jgi:hypothetical protein
LCALRFGKDYLDRIDNNNVYLTPIEPEKREEVLNFYKTQIASWNGVKAVFTDTELATQTKDKIQSMTTLGYDATRSGELVFVLQPGYLLKKKDTDKARKGTSHGSAFNYDTHVPVLFYGKNIPKQQIFTPYEIIDIVPTLTHILRVQLPNATTGKPMVEVLK